MPKNFSLPLLIDEVTRTNLLQALEPVKGCLKTTSMLWMQALDLPVLSGVVVDGWSDASATAVKRFFNRKRIANVLLRIDKRDERWTRRRGGYLLRLQEIPLAVEELKKEGMLAVLLEPASPYRDQYSLAGVTIPDQEKLVIEVVGPGFDASDILRGDLPPHERWEVKIDFTARAPSSNFIVSSNRIALVTQEHYAESVRLRLAKIGARLTSPAFQDSDLIEDKARLAELIQKGASFLRNTRQTLLLKHVDAYPPVPMKHIVEFARNVQKLLSGLSAYGIHMGPSSFAASVIPTRGLTFWDFFPAKKQEAASLYPVSAKWNASQKQ